MKPSLLEIARSIAESVETAADIEIAPNPSPEEQQAAYYQAQLIRANYFLDLKKNTIFTDVLALDTRGQMERALNAYDAAYLLGLGLSIEATADLANALIAKTKQFKVVVPDDWKLIAGMDIDLTGPNDTAAKRSVAL